MFPDQNVVQAGLALNKILATPLARRADGLAARLPNTSFSIRLDLAATGNRAVSGLPLSTRWSPCGVGSHARGAAQHRQPTFEGTQFWAAHLQIDAGVSLREFAWDKRIIHWRTRPSTPLHSCACKALSRCATRTRTRIRTCMPALVESVRSSCHVVMQWRKRASCTRDQSIVMRLA